MLQPGAVCGMALPAMGIEPTGSLHHDLIAVVWAVRLTELPHAQLLTHCAMCLHHAASPIYVVLRWCFPRRASHPHTCD